LDVNLFRMVAEITVTARWGVLNAKDWRMQSRAFFTGGATFFGHVATLRKRSVEITVRTGDHVEECTKIRVRGAATVLEMKKEPREDAERSEEGDISCHRSSPTGL
jgi:hypothetical protein